MDAAILFSDIVVPLRLAGVDVRDRRRARARSSRTPIRTAADVAALPDAGPGGAGARSPRRVRRRRGASSARTPLIGFAGAPFTLASYLVEGGPSRDHLRTKALMHADPETWHALAGWVGRMTARLPARAGAGRRVRGAAVRLLGRRAQPRRLPAVRRPALRGRARPRVADLGVPRVHFGVGTGELLGRDAGRRARTSWASTTGSRWTRRTGGSAAGLRCRATSIPALLFAGEDALHAHAAARAPRAGTPAPAHVVNLGHGVPPDTDPDVLTRLVEFVHGFDRAAPAVTAGMTRRSTPTAS